MQEVQPTSNGVDRVGRPVGLGIARGPEERADVVQGGERVAHEPGRFVFAAVPPPIVQAMPARLDFAVVGHADAESADVAPWRRLRRRFGGVAFGAAKLDLVLGHRFLLRV